MSGPRFWHVLGLEPTSDSALVRRAYAARLKQTNPEDDPEGFKALRAAYEMALNHVRYAEDFDLAEGEDDAGAGDDRPLPDPAEPASHTEWAAVGSASKPDEAPSLVDEELERHFRARGALVDALVAGAPPPQLISLFYAVLNSPAMQRVGVYGDAESWTVRLIHGYRPASEALIARAIDFFGWTDSRTGVADRAGATSILALRKYVDESADREAFLARVADKRHEFHRAYKLTTTPPEERSRLARAFSFRRLFLVDRFLFHIEDKIPSAMEALDLGAVYWWRRYAQEWAPRLNGIRIAAWAIFIVAIIAVLVSIDEEIDPQPSARLDRMRELAAQYPTHALTLHQLCRVAATEAPAIADGESAPSEAGVQARADCERAVALIPGSHVLQNYAALIELKMQNAPAALALYQSVLDVHPGNPTALFGKGLSQIASGEVDEGYANVNLATTLDPGVAAYFTELGFPAAPGTALETKPDPFSPRPPPPLDIAPKVKASPGQEAFDQAYATLGILASLEGAARVECLAGTNRRLSECRVVSESAYNLGLGEMAIEVAKSVEVEPGQHDGAAVDAAPLMINFEFRVG